MRIVPFALPEGYTILGVDVQSVRKVTISMLCKINRLGIVSSPLFFEEIALTI
jgi:hypothetical protein